MLIYVRHGKTELNKGGSEERLRGWLPVPLSEQGQQQAEAAGQKLHGLEPNTFTSSDLPRALQTAAIIQPHVNTPAQPDPAVRDWNTGDLAGQKFDDVKDTLFHLIANPDISAPNGEPLNAYLQRFIPPLKAKAEDSDIHLVVGHARGAMVLQGVASPVGGVGEGVDPKFLTERPDVEPGGMMTIHPTWKTKVVNPTPNDAGSDGG